MRSKIDVVGDYDNDDLDVDADDGEDDEGDDDDDDDDDNYDDDDDDNVDDDDDGDDDDDDDDFWGSSVKTFGVCICVFTTKKQASRAYSCASSRISRLPSHEASARTADNGQRGLILKVIFENKFK